MDLKKKILILGGEGFIGRNLANYLSDFYDCYSVGIKKSVFQNRKDKFIRKNPYAEVVENNCDIVIHLIDNKTNIKDFSGEEKRLIENINLKKKNHLIVFSSAVVYANPDSDYGKRKLALEKFYQNYCKENNIKLLILRLFNIYGSYQFPYKQGSLIANIICNYLNKTKTEINDLDAERDFIYAKDVARAVKYAIENKLEGLDDLATNKTTSIKELINIMEKDVIKNKLNIASKNIKENIPTMEAKSRIIKNISSTEIKKSLSDAFDFYKDNLKLIKLNS